MRTDYIYAILIFIPLTVLQLTIIPLISFNQIAPDLILIVLVYYTLKLGQIHGTILGFIMGLIFDMVSGGVIGSAMFAKTMSGFLTGYFYNENKMEFNLNSFMLLLIIFGVGSIDSVIYTFFSTTEINTSLFMLIFMQGLLPGLYSAVVSLPLIIFYPRKLFS
ncbi:MAG: rod shape-determining protein MreD [Bacteroidota bacterium]